MVVQPFIFNWNGKHENVNKIIGQLRPIFDNVTVINSDDNYCQEDWINIGNEFYFAGQFNTALKHFSGDVLFHIQGDVSYDRWQQLVDDAVFYMEHYNCGIYAPNLDYTNWPTRIAKIEDSNNLLQHNNLDIVSCTDETVWFIHKDIIDKLKKYSIEFADYDFGWGIDFTLSAISFLNKKLVLRDSAHDIIHPRGTNYNFEMAQQQLERLRASLPHDISKIIRLIQNKKMQHIIYKYLM